MNPETARISNLDYLRKVLSGTVTPTDKSPFNFPFPIMKTLGFKLVEVSEGSASVEMEAKTELHANPMGTLHSGVLCDIADAMKPMTIQEWVRVHVRAFEGRTMK